MSRSAESIANAWIEKWNTPPDDRDFGPDDLDHDVARLDPKLAVAAILAVLSRIPADPSCRHFQALAAGPLEDLIAFHGQVLLPEIELHARRDPAFRMLLNGVWFDQQSAPIREHLSKYLTRSW